MARRGDTGHATQHGAWNATRHVTDSPNAHQTIAQGDRLNRCCYEEEDKDEMLDFREGGHDFDFYRSNVQMIATKGYR